MTNQYKATSAYGKAIFGEDVFDGDFTAGEEKDHLDGGHLELVPRDYEVTSDDFSGGPKGSMYTAALVKEIEESLIAGYHLVRKDAEPPVDDADDDDPPPDDDKKPAAKKTAAKK